MAPVAPWLSHALRYAALGLAVFPLHGIANGRCTCGDIDCRSPGKHPLTTHGVKDASTDPDVLRAWAERWPASNLGMAMRDGLVCVDVDPRNGGDVSLETLQADHGPLPETVMALTGGGGLHYLYRNTDGRRLPGQLRKGIDLKGDGGYIVVEPSIHASGTAYAWEASSDPLEGAAFAPLPAWIGAVPKDDAAAPVLRAVGMLPPERVVDIRAALCYLDSDDRDQWLRVGMALHSTDAPNAYGLWCEWSQQSAKFNASDQRRVWASFQRSGIHVESIFAWAAAAGWVNPGSAGARAIADADAAIEAANCRDRIVPAAPPPEDPIPPIPVPALVDLCDWIDSGYAITHPDVTRHTVLALAGLIASRVYVGEGGSPCHLCLGVVAESSILTAYARDAVARCLDGAGMRRMFRGTRADAPSKVYATLYRSPSAIHVITDYGHLAAFARRQPSGAIDQAFAAMAEAYNGSAIYLDTALDAGLKPIASDEQLVVHSPALTTLLLSTREQMAALLHRSEMMRGLLAYHLPILVDTAGVVERDPTTDALPAALHERIRAVRRVSKAPCMLSKEELFGQQPEGRPAQVRVRYAVPFAEHAAAIGGISRELAHRPLIIAAQNIARRIANALGAWNDPQMPMATHAILDWSAHYVIRCMTAWLDRYETLGNEEGHADVAQKVLATVADRKVAGLPRGELHMYCRAYKALDREKRARVVDGLIEDGDLVEFVPEGQKKKVLVAARFAKRIAFVPAEAA